MAFIKRRQRKQLPSPQGNIAMSGLLSDIASAIKGSITSPLKAIQSNIEATNLLLKGDFSGANIAGKEGLEQIKDAVQSSLEPLVLIEQEVKKIVPEKYRQYAIGPAEAAELLATDPEAFAKEFYANLRAATARPVYELSGKLFGYDNAAYFVSFDIKPSDVGITEGTPEAIEFMQKRDVTADVAMSVIGTIYPYVGVAWALYSTARTVEAQKEAKELLDQALAQAKAEMKIESDKHRAILTQQRDKLEVLEAQLREVEAQKQITNAQIEQAAEGKENITTPGQKTKAALTIGATGALAAYLLASG